MQSAFIKSVRNAFLAGVIVLAPLAVTVWVFTWLVGIVGGRYRELFFYPVPDHILNRPQLIPLFDFLSTLIVLLLVTLLGYLSRFLFTRFLFTQAERLMRRVPVINSIYNTAKQIVDTFSSQRRAVFERVVLIQFPRPGLYALGFLTSRAKGEAQARTSEELWNVFVPTTPNPTSGFLIMVPREQILEMDMSVGEGMKLIISGGGVVPEWVAATAQAAGRIIPPAPEAPVGAPTR